MPDFRSAVSALALPTATLRAAGNADVDLAWERYAVPQLWATWSPQISRVETAAQRIAPGATGKVIGPVGTHVRFVIDDVDEAERTWTWRVRLGPVTLRLWHGVEARPGGCATTLRVHGPLPVVAGYAPLAQLALRRLVRL